MMQPPGECSDWASAYVTTGPEEDGYHMEVQGHLPPELTGTYFRYSALPYECMCFI